MVWTTGNAFRQGIRLHLFQLLTRLQQRRRCGLTAGWMALALLLTGAVAAQAQLTIPSINASVSGVSYANTKLAEAGYTYDGIEVDADVTFNRNTTFYPTGEVSGTFRVGFQLLDGEGTPVPMDTGGANPVTTVYDAGGSFTITLSTLQNSEGPYNYSATLRPDAQLDPDETYTVRTVVQLRVQQSGPLGTYYTWQTNATGTATPSNYYHFIGTSSGDLAVNALTVLNSAEFIDRSALAGTSSGDAAHAFQVRADTTVHRFDNWASARQLGFVTVIYDVELWRVDPVDGDEQIPLEQSHFEISTSVYNFNYGGFFIPVPTLTTVQHTLAIVPDDVQLDSVNDTFYVRVNASHVEVPSSDIEKPANPEDTSVVQLMHFNGTLLFDTIATTLQDFGNDPAKTGSWSASYIDSSISDAEGILTGAPDYSWGPNALSIRLEPDGTARVISPSFSVNVTQAAQPDFDATQNVRFRRSDLLLDFSTGLTGTLTLYLPTGMGWAWTGTSNNYNGKLVFSGVSFDQTLQPISSVFNFSPGGTFYVMEETKPIAYQATAVTWRVDTGVIETTATGSVGYTREDELSELEAAAPIPAELKIKRSNEQYYRGASSLSSSYLLTTIAGSAGDARLTADLTFSSASFTTHFPYDVQIAFSTGYMAFVDDVVDVNSSSLWGLNLLEIEYNQACIEDDCGAGTRMQTMQMYSGNDQFLFTRDGGLVTHGFVQTSSSVPDTLSWGYISSLNDYHHSTTGFTETSFHMSGHFIRGDENTGPSQNLTPAVILYTGYLATDPQIYERPATPGYLDGLTDYAGFNYRTEIDSAFLSLSRIASVATTFDLTGRCKYYIRPAGVTGIHEAVPGTFPSSMSLYGYKVNFEQYGLNYRSNDPDESRTSGSVDLLYPSDFNQPFEELKFTCLGGLDSAKVPAGTGSQIMRYWLANIQIHTIDFASENGCDPTASTWLLAGVSAEAAYVQSPLMGTLGFKPDGNLMIPQTAPAIDEDSRLRLPSVVRFDGPTRLTNPDDPSESETEVYQLVPVTSAYYNNFDQTSEQAEGDGKINFAATVDVSFFEDLEVHVQTSARNVLPTQSIPIYLMGGWEESGSPATTFFNSAAFDEDNTGFPNGVNEALYRNDPGASGDPTPYLIHARQDWLGVVTFDYLLKWSFSTRSFESYLPKTNDLLVITAEHKVDYLSAEITEMSVGITYEGLPRINLANFVINEIDEATGVYQAILTEAKKPIVDSIERGIDEMGELLDDRMQALYGDFLATTVEDQVITPFFDLLEPAAINGSYNLAVVNGALNQYLNTGSNSLRNLIRNLAVEVNGVNRLFNEVDGRLLDIELGITSIIDGAWVNLDGDVIPPPGNVAPDFPALLAKNLQGDFQILAPLVERLLEELAPDISSELNTLLAGAVEDLNARINVLLEEAKPTLDQVVVILEDLRDVVRDVRAAIEPAGDLILEMQSILDNADAEIVALTSQIQGELNVFFATIPDPEDFLNYTEEEIKQRMRQEIEDLFFGTTFVAEIQVTLKQYLYDVDAAINAAISEAFARVNQVMRELVSDALSEVDDTINGFLGDVDSVMGAGRLDGFAQFNNDALRRLHIDLYLQLMVPDELEFYGYLNIEQLDSDGDDTCSPGTPGAPVTEVTMGALDVPADWISPDLRINVEGKFNFQTNPNFKLLGLGGGFELTSGEVNFESFKITDMGASLMFGATENYLAAKLGLAFNSYEAFGGVYFGQTCTIDPLLMVDEDVAEILGEPDPTFTGVYVYGECHIPVSEAALGIPATCFFRISAGVGAGAFYFVEGNTLGGKIYAAASGEALCIVSIKGEVTMIGIMRDGDLSFSGKGRLSGKVGACPFCVKFGKTAEIGYRQGKWSVDL